MPHAIVVDDSRAIRRIITHALTDLGFAVSEAENGKHALDVLGSVSEPVSLILTDWNMPEMNGLDFLKEVRSRRDYDQVPVVMVTTETEMGQMVTAMEAGANEYVMKPFTRDILADKLRLAGVAV